MKTPLSPETTKRLIGLLDAKKAREELAAQIVRIHESEQSRADQRETEIFKVHEAHQWQATVAHFMATRKESRRRAW